LNTVTVNLKSVYMLKSVSFPFIFTVPISVLGFEGEIVYFEVFLSKVMKLGKEVITSTGFFSSSENLGSVYSAVSLNRIF
jgi:hypothetical protein